LSDKVDVLEALKHSNVFLTGGAGVGKSYITNEVISDCRKRGKQVISLGSTGVSAVNIGGFTVHSFFVFGIAGNFDELAAGDKRAKKRLADLKKILKATDLIIIDEIGYTPIEKREANLFFSLISETYERASIIITSNKSFESWAEMMDDSIMTTALLDRLLHHARVFNLDGESYRIKNQKEEV